MAGLLDYLSNLKFEPDAKSMGLMNMGANMMQASSMSPTPIGFGNVMGAGLGGFNQGYMAQKKDDEALALAEQKKLLDAATINKDNAMAGYYNTGGGGQNADNLRQSTDGWFRVNKDTKKPEFLVGDNGKRLMPQGSDLNLMLAKHGMNPVQTVDANGNVDVVPTAELDPFYANKPQPHFPNQQPFQNNISQPQSNLSEQQILGAYQNGIMSEAEALAALKSISPPGAAPNSNAFNPQPDLIQQASPNTGRQTPAQKAGAIKLAETNASRVQDSTDATGLLRQAAPLINESTNSWVGDAFDRASAAIGAGSTHGADVAAKLKVLGGALTSKMPKMSGPQSDKDVLLYREMAAQIGDPTVPNSQKRAAMNSLNTLMSKYAGVQEVPLEFDAAKPDPAWSIKEINR